MTPPSADTRLRRRHHRRRPGRPGRGGVRRLRGPVHPRRRAPGRRRSGRHQLADPQLPRLLPRHQRRPPRLPVPSSRRGRSAPSSPSCARSSGLEVDGAERVVRAVRRQPRPRPRGDRRHRRRLPAPRACPSSRTLVGRGVYYGAAVSEAPAMAGHPVFVVGGGNSAGQAALHLAKYAKQVTMLVRGADPRRQHVGVPDRPAAQHAQRRHPPPSHGRRR